VDRKASSPRDLCPVETTNYERFIKLRQGLQQNGILAKNLQTGAV
jgi:hypothetical protein